MNIFRRIKVKLAKPITKAVLNVYIEEKPDETISYIIGKLYEKITLEEARKMKPIDEELDEVMKSLPVLIPYRKYFENTVRNRLEELGVNPK